MDLQDALGRLGLGGKPARFYLAALEHGQGPVHEVAARAGISRTTAYDVLARLTAKGLVSRVEKDGRVHVAAEDPGRLLGLLEDQRRLVEEVLPELRALHGRAGVKPRIRFYEGRDGIGAVLHDTLTCRSKQLYGILSMTDLFQVPGRAEMEQYVTRRIAGRIQLQVVRSREKDIDPDLWPTRPEDFRELRYAPDGIVFPMTAWTYDDKVSIISSRREHFGLIIESPEFSALMRNLFSALWAASTPADDARRSATTTPRIAAGSLQRPRR